LFEAIRDWLLNVGHFELDERSARMKAFASDSLLLRREM
jgi:hypothetical protein